MPRLPLDSGKPHQPRTDAGPRQKDDVIFRTDAPATDQWSYHAVASVIRAHSLLRSFPEVDAERTAITGMILKEGTMKGGWGAEGGRKAEMEQGGKMRNHEWTRRNANNDGLGEWESGRVGEWESGRSEGSRVREQESENFGSLGTPSLQTAPPVIPGETQITTGKGMARKRANFQC